MNSEFSYPWMFFWRWPGVSGAHLRRNHAWLFILVVLLLGLGLLPVANGQQADAADATATDTNAVAGTPDEQRAAFQLEVTNAWQQVIKIINRPVPAYGRVANVDLGVFPEGWFHPGAARPDFDKVDVRTSQEFPYAKFAYVTSDLNPGVMFAGRDLEFNSMTKYFYVNRSLPKRKLTETEMLEINRLYRIIGRGQRDLRRLQTKLDAEVVKTNNVEGDTASETVTTEVAPDQPLASVRSIPRQTRILYGSIGIGALLVLVVVLRLFRKKSDS